MLIETTAAAFLLICLGCFFSVNLHSILKVHIRASRTDAYAEIKRPSGFVVGVAAVGTIIYFLEVLFYLFFVFMGSDSALLGFPFHLKFPLIFCMQLLGLVLTLAGYFIFIWSVIARGRYAVSWEMTENHRLVTWGPYRYVRHPSYLGYFLMFFGLFFLWSNLFTLFPLVAIPGYFRITFEEEKLLMKLFGDKYLNYQKKTGRFIPRFSNPFQPKHI